MDYPPQTNLYNLPIEILIKIFGYLNYYDLLTISLVCKRFLGIFEYPKTLNNLVLRISNIQTFSECPVNPLFDKSIRKIPNILIINSDINLFQEFLINEIKYVQKITFDTIQLSNEQQFIDIIQNAENLTELIMIKCNFLDIIRATPINVTEEYQKLNKSTTLLNIKKFTYFDATPETILIFLKILNLINPLKLDSIKLSIKKSDEQTNCCCCEFLQPFINRKLKSFEIDNIQLNCCKRKIFQILMNNDNHLLINLKISQSNIFNDSDIVQITNVLKNLKIFSLKNCYNLTNVSALSLENLKQLEELTISECSGILHGINSGGLKFGIAKTINKNLTNLILIFIDINSDCMIQLSENLPNLEKLIYIYPITTTGRMTCKITDFALQAIIKNLKLLKHLELMGCTWLTNNGLTGYNIDNNKQDGLSINELQKLEILNLFGCDKITDYFILNNFQLFNLRRLRLPQIQIESITILIDKCKFIEQLDIRSDFNTDEIINMAINNFPMLKFLRLTRFCSEGKKLLGADVHKYDNLYGTIFMNCNCITCMRLLVLFENFRKRTPLY